MTNVLFSHRTLLSFAVGICLPFLTSAQDTIMINEDLQLISLTEDLYIHISWLENEQYGRFSSNGMLLIEAGEGLLVDTPMKPQLTEDLVAFLQDSMQVKVKIVIPGHFHDDCINGIPYLHQMGVRSIAGKKTQSICREEKLVVPQVAFRNRKRIRFGGSSVELRYFGGGHAPDNIVAWFPKQKTLFGGCLIRSLEAKTLGNTADAVMNEWDATVEKIQKTLPAVETVIPGHGSRGNAALLQHTIDLVKARGMQAK